MVLIVNPGGNLVHKYKTKFDLVGERPASNSISKSTEQTEKSGKGASSQITCPCFLPKLPKRNGAQPRSQGSLLPALRSEREGG